MRIKDLHEYAQRLVDIKPDINERCYRPSEIHPNGIGGECESLYFQNLGKAAWHFLNTRKKFENRGKLKNETNKR
jgi:hypothetical protein